MRKKVRKSKSRPVRVVTLGGGTGQSVVLQGLRKLRNVEITAVCGMHDGGGSTYQLVRDYDLSRCTGDLTACLVALSGLEQIADALLTRFGLPVSREYMLNLKGHSGKNLLFAILEQQFGVVKAAEMMAELLQTGKHRVYPVSTRNATLVASFCNGEFTIRGEAVLDKMGQQSHFYDPDQHVLDGISLEPSIPLLPQVKLVIEEADFIVLSPGDLFTSLLPLLLVRGMAAAIKKSKGKIILIPNLMTKRGETDFFTVSDVLGWVERYLPRPVDYIICNNAEIPERILKRYAKEEKSRMIPNGAQEKRKIYFANLVDLSRNRVRHHPDKLARALKKFFVQAG